jgi:cysteine desulfurase family protein
MPEKNFAAPIIYLDQAATSRPKAKGVGEAMRTYIEDVCVNVSRSAYAPSTEAAINALETRELLCELFGFGDPTYVIFTPGHTVSLNMVLKGILRPGDHALVSSLEHNAVMRPLVQLAETSVSFDRIPMRGNDELDLDAAERIIRPNTKLCIVSHASNVSGTILPIDALSMLCQQKGVYFAVDAAQTAGHFPIDLRKTAVDALCVPGHKGLQGPGGIAAMLLSKHFAAELEPLITGGTGSDSNSEIQPRYMPDRFESGTLNLAGIYGLHAALSELLIQGVPARRERELALLERFTMGLSRMDRFRTIGASDLSRRVGVVSCDFARLDNAVVADRLSSEYGVLTRCGLHCAPNAHKTYGTFPQGTVRFSMSHSNTEEEIDSALAALAEILKD